MTKLNSKFKYRCIDCGKEYSGSETMYLCPECSKLNTDDQPPKGVLKTIYDYNEIKSKISGFEYLKDTGYIDLLPIESLKSLPVLEVGNTPLYKFDKLDNQDQPMQKSKDMKPLLQHQQAMQVLL